MVITSHMIVSTITLLDILNFYLLFKFNIYKKNQIVLTSHMMVHISHLMVPISDYHTHKKSEYCRMTQFCID